LAFIIFGRLAYLGSFNLKSVVIIAGIVTSIFSVPPSTSRLTFIVLSVTSTLLANVA
jgi:hypothetical protein